MNKLFTSSGYIEADVLSAASGARIDFQKIPAFLRVLLTTDGTVTKSLESFFWEPVDVQNLGQSYIQLDEDAPCIELKPGAKVMHRRVELRGRNSKQVYTKAVSLIRSELLGTKVRADLESGAVGVGELLRECGLETYREIVSIGQLPDIAGPNDSALETDTSPTSIWRRYRIIMNHQPFIQITEEFPLAAFRSA